MTFYRRPRVFISYRHQFYDEAPHAEHDAAHQAWVARFADDLAAWNVDVITDVRLRRLFAPYVEQPESAPFLAEASTLCLYTAHIFVPVITWSYVKRITLVSDILGLDFTQEGTVTREWNNASPLVQAGLLQLMLVQRQWTMGLADLHPLLNAELRFDFRERGIAYSDKIELLAQRMHMDERTARPYVDLPFSEWLSMYVRWCLETDPSCRDRPMADWSCDFGRAGRFFEYAQGLRLRGELPSASEGSGRHDLDQLFAPRSDHLDIPISGRDRVTKGKDNWWQRLFGKPPTSRDI